MSNNFTEKRLLNELKELEKDNQINSSVEVIDNDLYHWKAIIYGPINTPYEGGKFYLDINFPSDYPLECPKVNFITKIYHPNIHNGNICMDILKNNWSPILTISKVLLSISSLLSSPNVDDPLDIEIANLIKKNSELFKNNAHKWTQMYAI